MIDALFSSRITFVFLKQQQYVVLVTPQLYGGIYVGCCAGSGTGNHFLEHWRIKLQMLVKLTLIARQGHQKNSEKTKKQCSTSNMVVIVYCYIIGCEDEVTTCYYSTQLIEGVNTYDLSFVSHIQRIGCQIEKKVGASFFSKSTFSFLKATAVHCASDAATMVAYVEYCVGSGTCNHFL